jgi:AAA domain
MSILAGVTTKTKPVGQRIVIAGQEKVGKTTLACGAPKPLLIPMEMGYGPMTIPKTAMITTWDDVLKTFDEVGNAAARNQFPAQSLVWDSATALERLIHDATLAKDPAFSKNNVKALTMEAALGGYGKAYSHANELFGKFTYYSDLLAVNFGINTIVTCHVFASRITDPISGEYDTWDLLLHSPKNNKNYGKREMITQWADMVAFLYEPVHVIVNDKQAMSRAVTQSRGRVIGVDRTPGYVAGNRYGMSGELSIPKEKGWNYLADAVYKTSGIDLFNREL